MKVQPLARPLIGVVALPGDKSMSHRALLLAALCQGQSQIHHLGQGGDNRATIACLRQLGVAIEEEGEHVFVLAPAALHRPKGELDCQNSGTTMRLLAGMLSGLGLEATLVGDRSLSRRPMRRVAEPLAALGAQIETTDGHAPLRVRPAALAGGDVALNQPSAQVKTSLMLAGLFSREGVRVKEPELTRDHSERMMRALGFGVEAGDKISVAPLREKPAGFSFWVPGDPSSAAFWAVLATLVKGSDVTLIDVSLNPTRIGFVDILRRMGAHIECRERGVSAGEPWGDIRVRAAGPLRAITVEGHEARLAIDELPVLAVAMAFAQGTSHVRGAEDLRNKESDRIRSACALLTSAGLTARELPDGLEVEGAAPGVATVDAHDDHRVALSAAVFGLAGAGAQINGYESASVSYGTFMQEVKALAGGPAERGEPITVAIDGPAGAGKSTVSQLLAQRLGYAYVDTGAIYRAVALLAHRAGVDVERASEVRPFAENLALRFELTPAGQRVVVAGEDVTAAIRTPEISRLASVVSQHREVREALLELQRQFAGQKGAVLEGRDIGTVVFPRAEAKFFLDAAPEERARRRLDELQAKNQAAEFERVLHEIKDRDARDAARDVAPLKPAADAVRLDSTKLDVAAVVSEMERRVRAKEKRRG